LGREEFGAGATEEGVIVELVCRFDLVVWISMRVLLIVEKKGNERRKGVEDMYGISALMLSERRKRKESSSN